MKEYADLLLKSMVSQDPGTLPLADTYAATENSVPAALNMMTGWRTVTGVNTVGQHIVDRTAGQIFFTASLDEGGSSTLFWARLKVVAEKITELEMYKTRSRSDGGFVMLADELGNFPSGWTSDIPADGRANRDELEQLGKAIFDTELPVPDASPDCLLMELGGVVYEDPDYLDLMMHGEIQDRESDEKQTMAFGLAPFRPTDPTARLIAIDEEQGIVVVTGLVPGFVSPYVVRKSTESCFVPTQMIEMHRRTLLPDWMAGRQIMTEMPANCVSTQIVRMHSGKLQGFQLLNCLTAPGGYSPWSGV